MTAVQIATYRMLIGGEWVDARSGETFESVNPYTGMAWAEVPRAGAGEVDAAVRAARSAFDDWSRTTAAERGRLLRRLAALIAENAGRIAIPARRNGVGQRLPRRRPDGAVRRLQGQRHGRENGLRAVAEYTELKTVWIELTGATRDPFRLG